MAKTFDDMTKQEILDCIEGQIEEEEGKMSALTSHYKAKVDVLEDLKGHVARRKRMSKKLRAEFASLVPARN